MMRAIKLELQCPKNVNGLSADPNPDWSFNDLLSELSVLESKLNASPLNPRPVTKSVMRRENIRDERREKNEKKAFMIRVSDDEMDESDSEDTESKSVVPVGRFTCTDIYLSDSDDSEDDSMQQLQVPSMEKMGLAEGAFLELTHEYQLGIKERIRDQISALESELMAEKEKSTSALAQVTKNTEARRELDRKSDMHYQRKIAEALDNHMTAIQRDHEHRSQIEERKLRDDAAIEDAKRKEKAMQEESLRQQKAKAEEEMQARREAAKRAEEERKASEEAERLAKESADRMAREKLAKDGTNAQTGNKDSHSTLQNINNVAKDLQSTGNLVMGAQNALKLEERRLQNYKELEDKNKSLVSSFDKGLLTKERVIARLIKQITGSMDNVKAKAHELVKIFNETHYPQSVTLATFAKKVISIYETPNANFNTSAFACGYVIVYVSSQVPAAMDCLLAEFHRACTYTVPKHMRYSKAAYESKEAYFKAMGYREEHGNLETTDQYLERLGSYMKLYGALIQTEPNDARNIHDLEEGWIWLARFLNFLPANVYTAVALESFLRMAGFALHRKYKSQFRKVLKAISEQYVPKLKERGDGKINAVITILLDYIHSNKFLEEPEGWRLKDGLLSRDYVPEADYQHQYYHNQDRRYYY